MLEAATLCARGCNPARQRLRPSECQAGWRPGLPTASREAPPCRLMRLLEGEAFPLSTKERCPYLVFCEVTEDAAAEHAKARRRWGLGQVQAGASAAVARLSKMQMQMQVARRARGAKTNLPAEIRPAAGLGGSSPRLSGGGAGGGAGGEGGGGGGGAGRGGGGGG